MIYYVLIPLVLVVSIIYVLYRIGKKVKEKEAEFKSMMDESVIKRKLHKMKEKQRRQSTPRVPSNNKQK